jgi:hypothetical protein
MRTEERESACVWGTMMMDRGVCIRAAVLRRSGRSCDHRIECVVGARASTSWHNTNKKTTSCALVVVLLHACALYYGTHLFHAPL